MHQPGIARVVGDKIILDGTTIERVKQYHRETLMLVVETVNRETERIEKQRNVEAVRRRQAEAEHAESVRRIAEHLDFE